eukprot:439548-Hanusia_phi.AAC.1
MSAGVVDSEIFIGVGDRKEDSKEGEVVETCGAGRRRGGAGGRRRIIACLLVRSVVSPGTAMPLTESSLDQSAGDSRTRLRPFKTS